MPVDRVMVTYFITSVKCYILLVCIIIISEHQFLNAPSDLMCDPFPDGSGYGYGTVPGGRWTIDTEGGHVVVSVS